MQSYPPPPVFSQVFILKEVKVVCFDTLLQVFILKGLAETGFVSWSPQEYQTMRVRVGAAGGAGEVLSR
jgi:hypothetical protein